MKASTSICSSPQFDVASSLTGRSADLRCKSVAGKLSRYATEQAFDLADLLANPGLVQLAKPQTFNCGLHHACPQSSPKRDRAITKATAVSPLSPRCRSVLRASRALVSAILVTFAAPGKSYSPKELAKQA